MSAEQLPCLVLLGAPHALARSMAHALLQARQQALDPALPTAGWQCLAPQAGEAWPANALVYVLGQDWRDADPDPATVRQIDAWRRQLSESGQAYAMLYGKPSAQWLQLAQSLKSMAPDADWNWISTQSPWKPSARMRRPACEQCGDPECEKALFEALQRSAS
jgi:hypothetical protein